MAVAVAVKEEVAGPRVAVLCHLCAAPITLPRKTASKWDERWRGEVFSRCNTIRRVLVSVQSIFSPSVVFMDGG